MKKNERLELIKKIILSNEIETQHELLSFLEKEGLTPTQATISRDMNEIGIVKVPSKSGRYVYGLSTSKAAVIVPQPLNLSAIILEISRLKNMLNIEVVPGNSRLLKRHILNEFSDQIFSLVADDDSLLLVAPTDATAEALQKRISSWT
ncbi:arginine repressor [Streptococcus hillyeri]|uniref:Arginine repressor n=1 Tax=Streptococcus hillyeri TaxID=2282420 RepID=A0A3L9E2B8_9STRE|nr:ArgR family transcriptional regulator [Streptococcus hillyeri]RLY05290.1 ArgR family transcriptional regulator [Streptococcus hillyeri]